MSITDTGLSILSKIFKTKSTERIVINTTVSTPVEDKTADFRTNVKLTRSLYHNKSNLYALGAHLVKPIINNNIGFIYKPNLYSSHKNTNIALNEFKIPWINAHKMAERDGDCFIWPQWNGTSVDFVIISPDTLYKVLRDKYQNIVGYVFKKQREYYDEKGIHLNDTVVVTITANTIKHEFSGDTQKTHTFKNPIGIIPVFQLSNGRESFESMGHSEIENIEPQIKFYHDQTYEAGASQKRDGHPKMKINTKDPRTWVDNNFGVGTFDAMRNGQAKISLEGRDLYVNGDGDDVAYIVASQATGDYDIISKRTFTNLVEGSGTPEVVFGANLGTSLASVKEQRPVWIKKIQLKQEAYGEVWKEILDYALQLYSFATFKRVVDDYTLEWVKPDFKSDSEKIELLKDLAETIIKLKESNQLSDREAFDTLKQYEQLILVDSYEEHYKLVEESVDNDQSRLRGKLNTNNNQGEGSNEDDNDKGSDEDDEEKEED